jgi:hypothetical protein
MSPVPPPKIADQRPRRAGPRVSFPELTPAVLRFADGERTNGTLKLVSVTGGLLGLSRPIMPNSVVKLMFVGPTGSVFGTAKMLNPVNWSLQPFCFTTLHDDDQYKLRTAIQCCVEKNAHEDQQARRDHLQIEKLRQW